MGIYFFASFNNKWALTSLPDWSFRLATRLTSVGNSFFASFNSNWALTSLPANSFDTSKITTVGGYFFATFNFNWALTSLPVNSFDTSKITTVGDCFFAYFNQGWQLTSLPDWSFRLATWLTTVWNSFFSYFNQNWALTSLPANSFDTSNITTVGNSFFAYFNQNWKLTSLPANSFDTSNITTVGTYFFAYFNNNWQLTSLPANSFDTSNIITVGTYFFAYFNQGWQLTSLPEWSFDTSKITSADTYFFNSFNYNWKITNLPNSFKLSSVWASYGNAYTNAFRSPSYTLNRNVSDLVAWTPSTDRNTFSDNQPWRCGVHANWLVTPAWTCDLEVTYNTNGWTEVESDFASSWDKTVLPITTKTWYIFSWWYDALSGWNKVWDAWDVVTINESQTLYAQWNVNKDIVLEATATSVNQTLKINKYFANAYTVDRWDGNPVQNLTANTTHTYTSAGTYNIILSHYRYHEQIDGLLEMQIYN